MITTKTIVATKLIYYFSKKHPDYRWEIITNNKTALVVENVLDLRFSDFITFYNNLQFSHASSMIESLYTGLKIIAQHAN